MSSTNPPAVGIPERWTAATVYKDMWADPDDDPREGGVEITDERTMLTEYLRFCRATLRMKCEGLSPAQLAMRSAPPSNLSLLGMIRHLADMERHSFGHVMGGREVERYRTTEDRDADWNGAVGEQPVVDQAWESWSEAIRATDEYLSATADLDTVGYHHGTLGLGETISLRAVLMGLITEYARHIGQADLLRERIDGRVGQ